MSSSFSRRRLSIAALAVCIDPLLVIAAHGQAGSQGTVTITVHDATGASVPGASLALRALSTNAERTAASKAEGTFTFVNLPIGAYQLTVTRDGFATTVLQNVVVQAAQTTSLQVVLQVGKQSDTVSVTSAETPLLDTTSNSLNTTINLKWIEDLPTIGRDLTQLARLSPGFTGVPSGSGANGVFNGQQFANQGSNIDGTIGQPSRGKYNGNIQPSASPRVENIAEMTVQTDQLDLDEGYGKATSQVNFVTRSGSNQFHGRIFVNARNSGLFANTYANNNNGVRRAKVIYNDFGASLGGPILHDKLFFFGNFSTRRVPGQIPASNNYLTMAAQGGNFTYTGTDNQVYTRNVLSLARQFNASLPSTVNSSIASQLSAINSSLSSGGTTGTSDPNINQINWNTPAPVVYYWPTGRLDWNVSGKLHMYLAGNITTQSQSGTYAPNFPGSAFANQGAGYNTKGFTIAYGIDDTITPNLVNQFKAGYLYAANQYSVGAAPLYATQPTVFWGFDSQNWGTYNMSGQNYNLPVSNFYPVWNASDTISLQKKSHSLKFGGSWNMEQDHYWNPPAGFPNYQLGLAAGDPAINAFSNSSAGSLPNASPNSLAEAEQLYAVLTGRISGVSGQYAYSPSSKQYAQKIGAFNLDERQAQVGLYIQDSWRAFPTLTLNYGLRWDFTGDNHDLTNGYHNSSLASVYGPSGVGNLFQPGNLPGTNNPTIDSRAHAYSPWYVAPQPAFGFAWNPRGGSGFSDGNTVVRGGFNLRNYTMPQQYYWNNASSFGSFFYQNFYLNANTTGTTGTFAPGSLSLGNSLPSYGFSPTAYVTSESQADFTFLNNVPVTGINPHIRQPYTESWNLGFERKFGARAIEVRYVGNHSLHQWLAYDPNEVNIFENGFLTQFKQAQANYNANHASGVESFANNHLAGQASTPIFDAAFAGEASGGAGIGAMDYANTQFINYLTSGQAGALANTLSGVAGTTTYFCNLVGASFSPCANNAGYSGGGAGYPINFFQANPYAAGTSTSYMDAIGYSNYNSLQIDFRQQQWAGFQFDTNYTFSKTLGLSSTRNYTAGGDSILTLRNLAASYGPTPYDIRHVLHATATYDLPFGKNKPFLSHGRLVNAVVGGWTAGTIVVAQSGAANQIYGGNQTYNDYGDGGVVLNNVTPQQLQKAVGVHRIAGQPTATLLNPKYLQSSTGGGANPAYLAPNTTPGSLGRKLYLYGPHGFYQDASVSKAIPIKEGLDFRLQGEFLNAWNHPVFGSVPLQFGNSGSFTNNVQSPSFATSGVTNSPRMIEIRANLEF